MKVWSFQHGDAIRAALKCGYFTGEHEFRLGLITTYTHGPELEHGYAWMRDQMAKRLHNFSGDRPIWGHSLRVADRDDRWEATQEYLINFEVPARQCLLSNYMMWTVAIMHKWNREDFLEEVFRIGNDAPLNPFSDINDFDDMFKYVGREYNNSQVAMDRPSVSHIKWIQDWRHKDKIIRRGHNRAGIIFRGPLVDLNYFLREPRHKDRQSPQI